MHLEAVIERIWRYTWRPRSSELRDALRNHDRARLQMDLWRPWLSKFGDTLGGHDRASLEICTWRPWSCKLAGRDQVSLVIHIEAVIEWVWRYALGGHTRANLQAVIERFWRYTWRPWSSEVGDTLGGRDRAGLEIHLEAVIERDWTSTWRRLMDGTPGLTSSVG